ncbi:MAG: lipid-A-disaccharide synthase [Woeseiaceae bacterium]
MRVGLVAGEASGDLLGAGLIEAIRDSIPDATFEGVAGPAMSAAGCKTWESCEALAVMGLVEPLKEIPRLLRLRKSLIQRWRENPPDVFVGIDAPDFNLGLEKALRKLSIPTVHYVSPSIWAWRAGRVKTVKKAADTVLCILPFEKALYDAHGIDAVFVGHPKADAAPTTVSTHAVRQVLGLDSSRLVAVLPGSRRAEVERLGPIFAEAAALLARTDDDLYFVTPVATPRLRPLIEQQLAAAGVRDRFTLLDGQSQPAMAAADLVLLASGTAVLEAALLGKPTVAAYKVSYLTYFIAKTLRLVKLQYYTLPNLLTKEPYVPEFIQGAATAEAIAECVANMLGDRAWRALITDRFAKLRAELALGADRRAADAVIRVARQ